MLYRVIWEIDIHARSPKQAANIARAIQLDPENEANYFTVTHPSKGASKVLQADLNPKERNPQS